MKYALFVPSLIGLLSLPIQAAAPTFESAAPAAIMIDLSSGAGLYMKNPDARILPASMTKMMTSHIVFDLVASGKLKLSQKFMVRPETWKKWHGPEAGSTMYLSAGEQVSVENLLLGLVTLSGNDACVVLAEGVAGTEQAFVALMAGQMAARLIQRCVTLLSSAHRRSAIIPDFIRSSTAGHPLLGVNQEAGAPLANPIETRSSVK
jgi:serine-type D-Ala-D-Ala carboxypeptidase (penicillin-binding protein 5/6)